MLGIITIVAITNFVVNVYIMVSYFASLYFHKHPPVLWIL